MKFKLTKILNHDLLVIIKNNKFLFVLMFFYILSVFIGVFRYYSPVPAGDMWQGYLGFYLQLLDGNYSVWWSQHNEHRILLSKIFFYFDIKYFSGLSLLLIPLNLLLLLFCWCILLFYVSQLLPKKIKAIELYYFVVLLTVFSFSWKQDENIVWAFQSQFWFSYLLPLVAFTSLALSELNKDKHLRLYFVACFIAILTLGSMANGILALPILFMMSVFLKQDWWKIIFLFLLSLASISLYLYDYRSPEHGHSIVDNLTTYKFEVLLFFIEYLGSPLKSIYGSFILGCIHFFLIACVFYHAFKEKFKPYSVSVLAFLTYYLLSAIIISASRVDLGVKAALVGRYTTPSIMSLFLVLTLYLYFRPSHVKIFSKRNVTILAILMLGTQIRTVIKNVDKIHDRQNIEAMQLALGLSPKIKMQEVANKAVTANLSIFATKPYMNKKDKLGNSINSMQCRSLGIIHTKSIKHKMNYLFNIDNDIYIVNSEKIIIGVGVVSNEDPTIIYLVSGQSVKNARLYKC